MAKHMKKLLSIWIVLSMIVSFCNFGTVAFADEDVAEVSVETKATETPDETGSGLVTVEIPAEPVIVETPAEPVAVETPAEPVAVETPAEPVAVETPAEPVAVETPAEPVAVETPAEPVAVETPAEPVAVETPAEPVAVETPDEPVAVETPAEPVAVETPAEPVAVDTPVEPVAVETPSEPVGTEDTSIEESSLADDPGDEENEPSDDSNIEEIITDITEGVTGTEDENTSSADNEEKEEVSSADLQEDGEEVADSSEEVSGEGENEPSDDSKMEETITAVTETEDENDASADDEGKKEEETAEEENTDSEEPENPEKPEADANLEDKISDSEEEENPEEDREEAENDSQAEDSAEANSEEEPQEDSEEADSEEEETEEEEENEHSQSETAMLKSPPPAGSDDGWQQDEESGEWYYFEGGYPVEQTVKEIDGKYYAFDYNGILYSIDTTVGLPDENGEWHNYHVQADGTVITNDWYQDGNSWYYYGEGGKAASGLQTVNGTQYYFDSNGYMYANTTVVRDYEDKAYVVDENGAAYEVDLNDNGWTAVGDTYVYCENGTAIKETIRNINGKTYGFDGEGRMYANAEFEANDPETSEWGYYRANSNGELIENKWYEDEWNGWYYYGEGGKAVSGLQTINGSQYYFDYRGYMLTNTTVFDDAGNAAYLIDSEGHVTTQEITTSTGWFQIDDKWYYRDSGTTVTNQIKQIEGYLYAFNNSGEMICDETQWIYNSETGESGYCRADAMGRLKIGWTSDEYGNSYYYGENGFAYSGLYDMSGIKRYFEDDGRLRTTSFVDDFGTVYVIDEDGEITDSFVVTEDGLIDVGNSKIYIEDGQPVRQGIRVVGGISYGFDYNGFLYQDTSFELYDYDTQEWSYYRAGADGSLYTGWYQDDYDNWYYYGEGGKAASGLQTVNGQQYYFEPNGYMFTNSTRWIYDEVTQSEYLYRIDEAGHVCTGWYQDGENTWYYYEADGKPASGLQTIGGKDYYFNYDGWMYWNTTIVDDGNDYAYIIDEDGHIAESIPVKENGWTAVGETYVYRENGVSVKDQVKKIGSSLYGFDSNGLMFQPGIMYSLWNNETGEWDYYRAQANGALYVDQWVEIHDGYNGESSWYYYGENGKAAQGAQTVKGKQYYFEYGGRMKTSPCWSEDGTTVYYIGSNGVVTDVKVITANGWTAVGQTYVYKEEGTVVRGQIKEIGGKRYGFSEDGFMYNNEEFSLHDPNIGYGIFRAAQGGALYTNQWYKDDSGEYHYYAEDSHGLRNEVKKIGGVYYGFNYDGIMYENTVFSRWNSEDGEFYNVWYQAQPGGALYVNKWVNNNGSWRYYGDEGKSARKYTTIGGKNYYFDDYSCVMLKNTARVDSDGSYGYEIDENGIATKKAIASDGWTKLRNDYVYSEGGNLVKNQKKEIDGKTYYFDYNGIMYNNLVFYTFDSEAEKSVVYRAQSGGSLVKGWFKEGNVWYYYGDDFAAYEGLQTINGKQYYFVDDGRMVTNATVSEDLRVYDLDSNGYATQVTSSGKYKGYFLKSGVVQTNIWQRIDNRWYYFDDSGHMATGFRTIDDKEYAFDVTGAMYSNEWVYVNDGGLYGITERAFAGSNGVLLTGEQKIGGKWYYFDDAGRLLTGVVNYKNNLYLTGSDGVYIGKITTSNGWNKIGEAWYYVQNGEIPYGELTVNGKNYFFLDNGRMLANDVANEHLYGMNGVRVEGGWAKFNNGWAYVDPESHTAIGWGEIEINGKGYYFQSYKMMTGDVIIPLYDYYSGETYKLARYGTDGVFIAETEIKNNTWTLFAGNYYYLKDGAFYTGWVGDYYVRNGRMLTDTIVDGYYVQKNGAIAKNGWVKPRYLYNNEYNWQLNQNQNLYYYAGSDGKLIQNKWRQINGSWYYFNENYRMVTGTHTIDGKTYTFADSGKMIGSGVTPVNGWKQVDGKWTYTKDGKVFENGKIEIEGNTYYFQNGYMKTNWVNQDQFGYYLFDSNGKMITTTGWVTNKREDGSTYRNYIKDDHTMAVGWVNVDGERYYCDYFAWTGYQVIDGQLYRFDDTGKLIEQNTKQNGWVYWGNNWYYFANGTMLRQTIAEINGKSYGFNYSGAQVTKNTNWPLVYSVDGYYYFENGVLTGKGWKQIGSDWYYTDSNGKVLTGIQTIDGKTYYFDKSGRWIQ